jgi:hypothetical protein
LTIFLRDWSGFLFALNTQRLHSIIEADIQRMTTGWVASLLLMLVFVVELLLIWTWNFLGI